MNNITKAIIAIIILILLWGGTVYFRRGPIEQDLTANVKAALNRPEFSKVRVVEFDTASAALTEASKKTLDRAAEMLFRFPEKRVEVQGHTDASGQPDANMRLSIARADAVYQYLVEKGVSADRLLVNGYGDQQSIADNNTTEGRQRNRRVIFQVQ